MILSGLLPSKNFTLKKVSKMPRKDANLVGKQKNSNLEKTAKCTRRSALLAARNVRFLLSRKTAGLSIALLVSKKTKDKQQHKVLSIKTTKNPSDSEGVLVR